MHSNFSHHKPIYHSNIKNIANSSTISIGGSKENCNVSDEVTSQSKHFNAININVLTVGGILCKMLSANYVTMKAIKL